MGTDWKAEEEWTEMADCPLEAGRQKGKVAAEKDGPQWSTLLSEVKKRKYLAVRREQECTKTSFSAQCHGARGREMENKDPD